ncbi:MAG: ABC transporter permease [Bryobacteraceae bacterium]
MTFWRRKKRDRDLDREIRSHLEAEAADQQDNGLSVDEARYTAQRAFGNTTLIKEDTRAMWGWASSLQLWQDIRYAAQMLRKNYGFTAAAVLSLGLGIGANTAIFSVMNAVLFRPLPYHDPEKLVDVWGQNVTHGVVQGTISYPDFLDLESQNSIFTGMAAYRETHGIVLADGDEPERVDAAIVSANLFDLLGTPPELGRVFHPGDDSASKGQTVILSHRLWQSRFNSNRDIIGQPIVLDGHSYLVTGVMPAGFEFPVLAEPVQLWLPASYDSSMTTSRGVHTYNVIARLKSGATAAQAATQMNTIMRRLAQLYPDNHKAGDGARVAIQLSDIVGNTRDTLIVLFGAVTIVLLIACANIANLILVRTASRGREVAIRTALGAGRFRLVRQFLTENLLLALLGGSFGLLLGYWAIQLFVKAGPRDIPRLTSAGLDASALVFTLTISLGCTLLFGLVPSVRLSKRGTGELLNERARRSTSGVGRGKLRDLLVITEIALSLVMMLAAGLLLKTLWRLERVNPGFDPSHVLTFDLNLPATGYTGARRAAFFDELLSKVRTLPGVASASMVFPLPFSGSGITTSFDIEGRRLSPAETPQAGLCAAGRDYFRTMHIPFLEGRDFSNRDAAQKRSVAIIDEAFARRYFPSEDPIGKRVKSDAEVNGTPAQMSEIIGVVADLKLNSLRENASPLVFVPTAQFPIDAMSVVVRTQADPRVLLPAIREQVRAIDESALIFRGKTLDQYFGLLLGQPRFNALLLAAFAALALTLAIVGLYGAVSYAISQRTQEIGIRMALGATPRLVLGMVFRHGFRMIALGLAIGLCAAFSLMHLMTALLFGITATDPVTFVVVPILLTAVTALACYIPTRRAMRIDPLAALRYE